MLRRLELLGRFELDTTGAGLDALEVYRNCVEPFRDDAIADPKGFLASLRATVANVDGGFAAFGASRLVVELLGTDRREDDALALLDGGIRFKHERGLPTAFLAPYEWKRWTETHSPDSW